ncbi:uncharacterized protein isoform X2 [Rhodnius prolixus]|uniref:uncharacterized protein isoform X2 n=1 Tax=Rhodnius prolixus TaxID=13249 RepID=UPI003D18E6B7
MEREKVVKIESGWKCYCPHCGKVIVDLECDRCSKYSHGIWSFIKGTLIKYGFPLLAALSWIRWIYYSNKLQRAREEYILAREERKQLECQLQDIEFREGNFPPKENQENASAAEGYTPALQRKHILCVIKKLYKRVERNNCEIKNLKEQKVQLVEDLGEARRVLCEAMNNFEKVCKMKNIEPTTSSSNETSKQYFDCEDYNSQDYIWNNNNTAY